jgi:beta-glucosidase/6-phospho-beta-glucosidase/beta-galactosidase
MPLLAVLLPHPQCAMFLGWITGMHPPGKILACITAGKVVMHKLQAHCEAYEAIKRTPLGKSLQVSPYVKSTTQFNGFAKGFAYMTHIPACV